MSYEEYLEKRDTSSTQIPKTLKIEQETVTKGKDDYNRSKERSKNERRLAKVQELIKDVENKIDEKNRQSALDENQSNYALLCQISTEIEELEEKLLTLMEECENLEKILNS
jgi:hypothetical protein